MLGFGSIGRFALGQVGTGNPSPVLPGVSAVGSAGNIGGITGSIPGVSAIGSAGIIRPTTLSINPGRLLVNVIRRTRILGRLVAVERL
jgi:hypothetical protein